MHSNLFRERREKNIIVLRLTVFLLIFSFLATSAPAAFAQTVEVAPDLLPASAEPTASSNSVDPVLPEQASDKAQEVIPENSKGEGVDTGSTPEEDTAKSALTTGNEADLSSPNLAVGSKQKVQVDENSGALNFTFPIVVPPGRNNLTPTVNLVYNSQDQDNVNVLGYGWSLDIPSISRINKLGTDKLYTQNYFTSSLAGELVDAGSGNFLPKTENGDFSSYTFDGTSWVVKDKQGTTFTFGANAGARQDNPGDSAQVYKWMLEEVRDTNDNYIKYTYFKDAGQIYPSTIVYTGNGVTDGQFSVSFTRTARPDNMTSFSTGFLLQSNYRITEISVSVAGAWARKYAIAYSSGDNGLRSMISSITESGRDESLNTTTLPATTFTYQSSTPGWDLDDTSWTTPDDMTEWRNIVDIDGDSKADIVKSYEEPAGNFHQATYINEGFSWTEDPAMLPPILFQKRETRRCTYNAVFDQGVRVADLNGDQYPDIIQGMDRVANPGVYQTYINNAGAGWVQDLSLVTSLGLTEGPYPGCQFGTYNEDYGGRVLDLNGDGLADITRQHGNFKGTQINEGGSFSPVVSTWDTLRFWEDRFARPVDVNSDGLTDMMYSWTSLSVPQDTTYLNNGTGGWPEHSYLKTPIQFGNNQDNGVRFLDLNGDGLTDTFVSPGAPIGVDTYINRGTGWAQNNNWNLPSSINLFADLWHTGDFNQDGLIDFLRRVNSNPTFTEVYLHRGVEPDLLSKVTYSSGGSTDVSYQKSAQYKDSSGNLLNPNLPLNLTTVKSITINDGLGLTSTDTYSYEGGKYFYNGVLNRKLAGFSKRVKTDTVGNKTTTFYHQGDSSNTASGEYQDEMWKIGRAYREEVASPSGSIYTTSINKWDSADLGSGSKFVKLAQTLTQTFDGDATHKDKAESYVYNNTNGNLTQKTEWGEVVGSSDGSFVDSGSDKRTTDISYAANTGAHIFGQPSITTTTNQTGGKVSESKFYYDNQALGSVVKGNLTKQEDWVSGTTYVNTQKSYDSTYGLVTSTTDPRGKVTQVSYDSYNLYPATVTNPLTQTTQYLYDYTLGKPKQVLDPNGLVFQTVYDGLDRVVEEKQPDQTTPSTLVTKTSYVYTLQAPGWQVKKTDFLDASNSVDTYTYTDGLDRVVQVRTEAESAGQFAVVDTVYGNTGQVTKESLPYFSTGSGKTAATTNANLLSQYSYDPLYRVTSVATAVGSTNTSYSDWKTTVTDPRGKAKDLYSDAYGNLVRVDEHNIGAAYTTNYEYNGNNQLTRITDALSNVRNFTYDGLGRRLTAEDLHAALDTSFGSYTYTYDNSGNLLSSLDPNSQTTVYTYDDLNRPLTEDFTGRAGTEVLYTYDTCTLGVGKLCSAEVVGTTLSQYSYSPTGQVAVDSENISSQAFTTSYTYDRQGNQLEVTNPDSSKVRYTYNTAGQLETVDRKEATDPSWSLVVLDYDYGPHGKVIFQENANGATTTNTYDATKLYRLSNKLTVKGALNLQNLSYTYDANGNVTQLVDSSSTSTAKTVNYTYDDLNRLLSSTATGVATGQETYTYAYTYDALGNILTRSETVGVNPTTVYTYSYSGNQGVSFANPHAVTSISDGTNTVNYTYDNNGNLLSYANQTHTWDYKNRLVSTAITSGGGGTTQVTGSFYPYAGDGSVYKNNSTNWNTTRTATSGNGVTTGTTAKVAVGKNSTKYYIERAFLPFDTSSIPAGAIIDSAKLKVYVNSKTNTDNDGTDWVTVVQGLEPNTASLSTGDYDLAGTVNNATEGIDAGERKDITSIGIGAYTEFNLNSTGLSWITPGAESKFALREGHDIINSTYSGSSSTSNSITFQTGESGASVPVFEVTYTVTTPPNQTVITYSYDHTGQRVKLDNGTTATLYPTKYYNLSGTKESKHIFTPSGDMVATVETESGVTTVYYQHLDHLSGQGVTTDQSGIAVETVDYYPYGGLRIDEKTGSFSEQRKFTGHELDLDTGLTYANARYYNASIGRFISQDQVFLAIGNGKLVKELTGQELQNILSDPQNINVYAYGRSNPLSYQDPTGQWSVNIFAVLPNSWQVSIGNKAESVYQNNSVARYALDHPYQAGVAIGVVGGALVAGGVIAGGGAITCGVICGPGAASTVIVGASSCVSGACQKAQVLVNQSQGLAGEVNSKIVKNTQSIIVNGRVRIPDVLDYSNRIIGEVKTVKYQSLTSQLRDFMTYAQDRGYQFKLIVDNSTKLSGPLQQAVNAGKVILERKVLK